MATRVQAQTPVPFDVDSVFKFEGLNQKELYNAALVWLSHSDYCKKVTLTNEDEYRIVATMAIYVRVKGVGYIPLTGAIDYELDLQCRDGRCRIKTSHYTHKGSGTDPLCDLGPIYKVGHMDIYNGGGYINSWYRKAHAKVQEAAGTNHINKVVLEFRQYVNDKRNDDDW